MLGVLMVKLQAAESRLGSLAETLPSGPGQSSVKHELLKAKKWKYSLLKDNLAEVISDLEAWQRVYDLPWYLMMTIQKPEIDRQLDIISKEQRVARADGRCDVSMLTAKRLRQALQADSHAPAARVFLPPEGLIGESIRRVAFSSVMMARRTGNNELVLLDPVAFRSRSSVNNALRDVRDFARALRHADPFTFGLLECKGVLRYDSADGSNTATGASQYPQAATDLSFVFRVPSSHQEVTSLRYHLMNQTALDDGSLSERFDLARQLVQAVNYVHVYGYVHKNVRPEAILLLSPRATGTQEKAPGEMATQAVLTGFDTLRNADGQTQRVGDDDWKKNLYRHPSRQGRSLEVNYEMRHDIYSVGICLLEIGLWESFVLYNPAEPQSLIDNGSNRQPFEMEVSTDGTNTWPGRPLRTLGSGAEFGKSPEQIKDYMLSLAKGKLRHKMGTRYGRIVETCLTCLDVDNEDFGNEREFQDEDGIAVGVRYIEKVAAKLSEIVI
jgi:hypothetical protein